MEEQVERVEQVETSKNSSTSSKYAGGAGAASAGFAPLGSSRARRARRVYEGLVTAMAAEIMIGFWSGVGAILAVKTVQSLEYCIEELISRK